MVPSPQFDHEKLDPDQYRVGESTSGVARAFEDEDEDEHEDEDEKEHEDEEKEH